MGLDFEFTADRALLCIQRELICDESEPPKPLEMILARIDAILGVYLDQFSSITKDVDFNGD